MTSPGAFPGWYDPRAPTPAPAQAKPKVAPAAPAAARAPPPPPEQPAPPAQSPEKPQRRPSEPATAQGKASVSSSATSNVAREDPDGNSGWEEADLDLSLDDGPATTSAPTLPQKSEEPPAPAPKCSKGHALRPERRSEHVCDSCSAEGTDFCCSSGCDYDLCRKCYDVAEKGASASSGATRTAPAQAARDLNALEVARTVDQATKAKEELAKQSIYRARDEVAAQRAALQAQMREQERRLREEEEQLARLENELKTGCNQGERAKIQALRARIEEGGREERTLDREVATKREAMRRATDAYVDAEERLAAKKAERRKWEEEMLELILETGKAKDEKLTGLLMQVPTVVGASADGAKPVNSAVKVNDSSVDPSGATVKQVDTDGESTGKPVGDTSA